jgi:hypothetical protein
MFSLDGRFYSVAVRGWVYMGRFFDIRAAFIMACGTAYASMADKNLKQEIFWNRL